MWFNIGTPKNTYFPFGTNGKLVFYGVPILKHFKVLSKLLWFHEQNYLSLHTGEKPYCFAICSPVFERFDKIHITNAWDQNRYKAMTIMHKIGIDVKHIKILHAIKIAINT